MKKVLFIMAAALLTMTQCRKSEDSAPSEGKTVNMTVTVGPGSKTDITDTGRITWSSGDKLYVGDGSKYVGYLTLASGDEGHVTGRFTGSVELTDVKEGDELTFHFYYLGSADHTNLTEGDASVDVDFSSQNIYKNGNKLENASRQHVCYGSAKGTVKDGIVTDINVVLVSKVAIASFSFTDGTNPYTGALKLRGDNIYNKMTVSFNSTEGFACEGTKGDISLTNTTTSEKYVMLVPTSSTNSPQTLTFTGGATGTATLANGIRPNKFYGLDGAIAVTVKPAEFSVGASTTVEFAPGNLYWDGSAFRFEADQWSFANTWATNHVSHFFWSKTASVAYASSYSDSGMVMDVLFTNVSGFQVNGYEANIWRTLTKDEWSYLLGTASPSRANAGDLCAWVTLTDVGVSGLVILPDGSSDNASDITMSSALAPSGVVFLPAVGYRNETSLNEVGSNGRYWSTTPSIIHGTNAYYMRFTSEKVDTFGGYRRDGTAVRLVRSAS